MICTTDVRSVLRFLKIKCMIGICLKIVLLWYIMFVI